MLAEETVSIIISNYNYGRFLGQAIDSALGQTCPGTEVVVVDDGSTDESRDIIARYARRVVPVLKENGGQASAFNAGLAASRGRVVIFLDSDDWLTPTAAAHAADALRRPGVVKAHWPLWDVDYLGNRTGHLRPRSRLAEGDLRDVALREGPDCYVTPPTSGNAWAREFLDRVVPIPAREYRLCADAYLFGLAPLFGAMHVVDLPQGFYRLHEQNNYARLAFEEKLRRDLVLYEHRCTVMGRYCRELRLDADPRQWIARSWLHRLDAAAREIAAIVPPATRFILVDEDSWNMRDCAGRRPIPFPERDGLYWGRPADDAAAIRELERLRRAGARLLVVGWPAFWWLEYYAGFRAYLRSEFHPILDNDRLIAFDLGGRRRRAGAVGDGGEVPSGAAWEEDPE
jgi:glycosyltransferase involved in cell wall biosynthesis